jgi:hypothetical protein
MDKTTLTKPDSAGTERKLAFWWGEKKERASVYSFTSDPSLTSSSVIIDKAL